MGDVAQIEVGMRFNSSFDSLSASNIVGPMMILDCLSVSFSS